MAGLVPAGVPERFGVEGEVAVPCWGVTWRLRPCWGDALSPFVLELGGAEGFLSPQPIVPPGEGITRGWCSQELPKDAAAPAVGRAPSARGRMLRAGSFPARWPEGRLMGS